MTHRARMHTKHQPTIILPILPFTMSDPMDVLFGGPDPLMPDRRQPMVGQRKAKKSDKAKRKRTQQARRANRK